MISRLLGRCVCLGLLFISSTAPAQLPASLTTEQRARVERGEAVQLLDPIEGSWPASTIYQLINATPEQSAAVLSDYALQTKYVPHMKGATVVRQNGPDVDVAYVIDIPIFPDDKSVSRQQVIHLASGYRIVWNTLVDSAAPGSITHGTATLLPYMRGGREVTLLIHHQSVKPASMFANVPFVRNKAIQASVESVEAIRKQVEMEVARQPDLLKAQLARLKSLAIDSTASR